MIGVTWVGIVLMYVSVGVIRSLGPPGRVVAGELRFIPDMFSDEANYGGIYTPIGENGWHPRVTGRFVSIEVYEGFVVGEIESGPYVGAEPGFFVIDLEKMYCRKELSEAEYRVIFKRKGLDHRELVRRIRF